MLGVPGIGSENGNSMRTWLEAEVVCARGPDFVRPRP